LTLDSWRPGRDEDGWKTSSKSTGFDADCQWDVHTEDGQGPADYPSQPPDLVLPVPRYEDDLAALRSLTQSTTPPLRYERRKAVHTVVYGFVDASGHGFGSSLTSTTGVSYTIGVWGRDDESQSSNYRELHNLVATLERYAVDGTISNSEVFMFTDNTTAEAAFYKGNTPSRRLFKLVLRLRQLEMHGGLLLQVMHIAGTRMMAQGTDGLSRGDVCESVMAGQAMLHYIPLHLSALDRQPRLLPWIQEWSGCPSLSPLTPEEWYDKGHGHCGGQYTARGLWMPEEITQNWLLWVPPPSAASAALEELLISRHKRTHLNHIMVIPRLATASWRKKLFKVSDLVFEVPPGKRSFWPAHEHEPLVISLTLRFCSLPPWQLRQSPALLDLAAQLQGLWSAEEGSEGIVLCELSVLPGRLESV